ncbi:MAG TPA: hypothetical protein VFG42_17050 [Baekduia sp.]|uniref:hypothetical protein n=1 Tax=Baekduia sp. TaxID=2600305 RepID=UPI002D78A686|nr:hypothetical protein [Baekduia sp.]HET6508503.1 hypothetical protein [Baekduia sp.]
MMRLKTRLLAATISAAAIAAATAGAAQAAPTLTPSGPYTAPASIAVTGTVPTALAGTATHYAIAECNIGAVNPATWAQRCDGDTGAFTSLNALSSGTYSGNITISDVFDDVDFSGATSPTTTTFCAASAGSDPCAVLVSFYEIVGGVPQFVGIDYRPVTFH